MESIRQNPTEANLRCPSKGDCMKPQDDIAKETCLSQKSKELFEKWAQDRALNEKTKEKAFQDFLRLVEKSKYEPGEAIGIIAAQSISEQATQMTMRSYTLATQRDRISKITQGLPRLIEIFDARKTFEKNMKILDRKSVV